MIKFTINKNAFLAAMRIAKQAIGSKIAIPVLSKMKIIVSEEGIHFTASNGQISIEKLLSADSKEAGMLIESEGGILLEANFFDSVIAQLPDNTFEFEEIDANQVLIRSGKSEITLKGQQIELYPMIMPITTKPYAKIAVGELKELFNETAFAVSQQESRPILTGVHLQLIEHQNLQAVATDSHRMSQRRIRLESFGEDFQVVVPNKAVAGFKTVFSDDDDNVSVFLNPTQILFKNATINFYSRLVEGNYPDTDRLIPEENLYTLNLTLDVADTLHAMNRAKLLTAGLQGGTVKLSVKEDQLILTVNTPEIGSSFEELPILEKNGHDLEISFNPQFLIDALRVLKEPQFRIFFISPVRPFTLIPKEEGANFIQLITPVRTN
ncbi:MAG: DNA polymerase III subunit beta [Streptococcaceae bacterium]|jgi:DNA polymerase-3 subunit beta|nr:DNA polymerase III subunit beta [Streptococcaceae bacterium]